MSSAHPGAEAFALDVASDDFVGRALDGRYYLTRRLGAGGMGSVYECEHTTLGSRFAVKVLRSGLAAFDKNRRRFLHEARAAAAIRSPYVVQIYDYGVTSDGLVYFVMELLLGQDLACLLKEHGPLPWSMAQPWLLQIARGLQAAHGHGVIHRDVKASNCFILEEDGAPGGRRVKLLDFGIAKHREPEFDANGGLTAAHEIIGTVGYIAPERIQGMPASPASDVYSVGALMFRMLVGRLPFRGKAAFEIFEQQVRQDAPAPSSLVPSIPAAVDELVLRALERDPGRRFPDMAALVLALEGLAPTREEALPRREAIDVVAPEPLLEERETVSDAPLPRHEPSRADEVEHAEVGEPSEVVERSMSRWRFPVAAGIVIAALGSLAFAVAGEGPTPDDASGAAYAAAVPLDAPAGASSAAPRASFAMGVGTSSETAAAPGGDAASGAAVASGAAAAPRTGVAPGAATPGAAAPAKHADARGTSSSRLAPPTSRPSASTSAQAPVPPQQAKKREPKPRRAAQAPRTATAEPTPAASAEPASDAGVLEEIRRLAAKRCHGDGTAHVRGVVGSEGRPLSVSVTGGQGAAECIRGLVRKQRFRSGETRTVTLEIPFEREAP